MISILHIETSGPIGSAALSNDGVLVSNVRSSAPNTHAQQITLLIDECLSKADTTLSDLSAISISQGPGSYTGLRVAASAAKAFCYALDIPMIAIDTLQSLAQAAAKVIDNTEALYIPMIDARRMEVYTGVYGYDGQVQRAPYPKILDESGYRTEVGDRAVVYAGNGVAKCADLIDGPSAILLADLDVDASQQALLAYRAFQQARFEDIAYFKPVYLKEPNITTPKPIF